MKSVLVNYFSKITPLSDEEAHALAESMVIKKLSKHTLLLEEGQFMVDSYFIIEGCIRQYSIIDGEENTTNFFTENQWVISLNSFSDKNPAPYSWICNEDTTVVVGNEMKGQELFKQFPRFETISRIVMEKVFSEQQEIMTSYLIEKPEQRYQRLVQSKPNLIQRIPQYQLASYIGVSPESLSRIRKRLSNKKVS